MLDRHYSPAQVAELLSVSRRHAYDIIYQMPHLESTLRVSEKVLRAWIDSNTVYPAGKAGKRTA